MIGELALAACLSLSPAQCATCGPGGGMEFSPGSSSGSWTAGAGGGGNPYDSVSQGGGGGGDQLYPFDSPEPWLHGWFQEIPAYGGFHTFRPHNYKHVIAQMEVAGRWGMSPMMPYSHQWYHPYRQRAGMHPDFGAPQASYTPGNRYETASSGPVMMASRGESPAPVELQQVGAIQRGYTGAAIPGISTPYYQQPINSQPLAPVQNRESTERFEALQKQLEQQTFQLQLMQEQIRNQPNNPQPLMPWQIPNYAQFPEYQQHMGYQELPPPNPAMGAMPAQAPGPASYAQPYVQPGYMQPNAPQNGGQPMLMMPSHQPYSVPQPSMQPGMQPGTMPYSGNVPMNVPTMGPMVPPGQAYYPTESAIPQIGMAAGGYSGGYLGNMHATHNMPAMQLPQGNATFMPQQGMAPAGFGYAMPNSAPQQVFFPQATQSPQQQYGGATYRPQGRY